jgi:hypothetical protein
LLQLFPQKHFPFSFLYKMPAKGKRKAAGKQAGGAKSKQAKQAGQKAVSKELNVPIDEGFKGSFGERLITLSALGTGY